MASFAMVFAGAPLFMWIYAIRTSVFINNICDYSVYKRYGQFRMNWFMANRIWTHRLLFLLGVRSWFREQMHDDGVRPLF
jgi:hypothetical protein